MPSDAYPHPEERPKGASRRTQHAAAALVQICRLSLSAIPVLSQRIGPRFHPISFFSLSEICSGALSWVKLAVNRPSGSMT
jgi:hypothetical protein